MEPMERRMKRTLIRYKTRPELAEKNAQLIASVFKQLEAAKPDGVRYVSLRLMAGSPLPIDLPCPAGQRNVGHSIWCP